MTSLNPRDVKNLDGLLAFVRGGNGYAKTAALGVKVEYGHIASDPFVELETSDGFFLCRVEIERDIHNQKRGVLMVQVSKTFGPRHSVAVLRAVKRLLKSALATDIQRVECAVDASFDKGHRAALALGFNPEGLMRKYSPEGRDYLLYAIVR